MSSFQMKLDGPRLEPAAGGAPEQLVVLLHGWGANGDDLIGLAPYLARGLPQARFIAPNAPFPCEQNPMGLQWFSLTDRSESQMLAGLRLAASLVDGFLDDALTEAGLDDSRLALIGFSQGTMLALQVALRRRHAPAAVIGYSGALIGPDALPGEITARPPVLLVHGDRDPVVPPQASQAAERQLKALDVPVQLLLRSGLPHSIDEVGMQTGLAALRKAFASS